MVKAHFDNIRQYILEELDKANEKIVVAVYWFTNHTLFQKLIAKVVEGIRVELIVHNDYINNRATGLNFQKFIDSGGEFYFSDTFNPMHNKFCVIDDKVLINGSYNWTYYAEDRNRENILLIKEEQETINAFITEFERLKSLTEKVEEIQPLTKFEIDEFNLLRTRDYLANDIVFQAKATGDKSLVNSAFELAPENIAVQKTAFDLKLTDKFRLKHSIGSSLKDDGYKIIVPKGSFIPVSEAAIVVTVSDNQTTSEATIHYGENPIASQNKQFAKMKISGLPRKGAGLAKMKYHFTIDIYGNLRMEKYSLDNGVRQNMIKKITGLLEKVEE
ncbi:phospholipase D-like domain-containing protein [Flavobacterium sp. HBTb2-11-1]|uniref:phospholipase D-like domain-containing protein n=1 Tax=Flavobacterium sp. HBTb2-11-1 TaxID=2692212 RepID=UPI00136A7021|nr:phospholipase D-like domain-containing protein [Flavobacterium sp. HBTb2-11-1]MXO04005.1 Hsp70 family protein [Flavobacterium sp. HBTb2-11-1]